jgi:hypothetical protein
MKGWSQTWVLISEYAICAFVLWLTISDAPSCSSARVVSTTRLPNCEAKNAIYEPSVHRWVQEYPRLLRGWRPPILQSETHGALSSELPDRVRPSVPAENVILRRCSLAARDKRGARLTSSTTGLRAVYCIWILYRKCCLLYAM